jgi:hypothetical protein
MESKTQAGTSESNVNAATPNPKVENSTTPSQGTNYNQNQVNDKTNPDGTNTDKQTPDETQCCNKCLLF